MADDLQRFTAGLANDYAILEGHGHGGMATVHLTAISDTTATSRSRF